MFKEAQPNIKAIAKPKKAVVPVIGSAASAKSNKKFNIGDIIKNAIFHNGGKGGSNMAINPISAPVVAQITKPSKVI